MRPTRSPARGIGSASSSRSKAAASRATSFSTRSSSLGRPAASGVECHRANATSSPDSRTKVVSPMASSRVSAISRVKSTPGKSALGEPPTLLDSRLGRARAWRAARGRRARGAARPAPASPSDARAPGRSGCRSRCCPPSAASSPARSCVAPWLLSHSMPVRTISEPSPSPWRSGRTASGPIQPSVPDRCTMLKATMWPSASRQTMAPSPASSMA